MKLLFLIVSIVHCLNRFDCSLSQSFRLFTVSIVSIVHCLNRFDCSLSQSFRLFIVSIVSIVHCLNRFDCSLFRLFIVSIVSFVPIVHCLNCFHCFDCSLSPLFWTLNLFIKQCVCGRELHSSWLANTYIF